MGHERKYVVEVRVVSSSSDNVVAEANLVDRYEIDARRRVQIAEALRELAEELEYE